MVLFDDMGPLREEWVFCFALRGIVDAVGTQPTSLSLTKSVHTGWFYLPVFASLCLGSFSQAAETTLCTQHTSREQPSITDTRKLVCR